MYSTCSNRNKINNTYHSARKWDHLSCICSTPHTPALVVLLWETQKCSNGVFSSGKTWQLKVGHHGWKHNLHQNISLWVSAQSHGWRYATCKLQSWESWNAFNARKMNPPNNAVVKDIDLIQSVQFQSVLFHSTQSMVINSINSKTMTQRKYVI